MRERAVIYDPYAQGLSGSNAVQLVNRPAKRAGGYVFIAAAVVDANPAMHIFSLSHVDDVPRLVIDEVDTPRGRKVVNFTALCSEQLLDERLYLQ